MPRFRPTLLMRQPWSVMTARFLSNYRLFLYASFKVDLQIQNRTQSSQRRRPVVLKWLSWLHLIAAIFVDFSEYYYLPIRNNSVMLLQGSKFVLAIVANATMFSHLLPGCCGNGLQQRFHFRYWLNNIASSPAPSVSISSIRFQICIDIDHIWITQVQYVSFCCRNCCRVLAVDHRVTRTSSS